MTRHTRLVQPVQGRSGRCTRRVKAPVAAVRRAVALAGGDRRRVVMCRDGSVLVVNGPPPAWARALQ